MGITHIEIRTKKSKEEVMSAIVQAVRDITKSGTRSRNIVSGVMTEEILRENMIDFRRKSRGMKARDGSSWAALADFTIKKKINRYSRGIKKWARRELRATFRKEINALEDLPPGKYGYKVAINIERGYMVASMRPGNAYELGYQPPNNLQIMVHESSGFYVKSLISYMYYAQRGRTKWADGREHPARPVHPPARLAARVTTRVMPKALKMIFARAPGVR